MKRRDEIEMKFKELLEEVMTDEKTIYNITAQPDLSNFYDELFKGNYKKSPPLKVYRYKK